jgi:hypothetical protein
MSRFTESPDIVEMRSRFVDPWPPVLSVGEGWTGLLLALHFRLCSIDENYRLYQVKEKFGALRVYLSASDENKQVELDQVVLRFSTASMFICEKCGAPGRLRQDDRRWFFTACAHHSGDNPPLPYESFYSSRAGKSGSPELFFEDLLFVVHDVIAAVERILAPTPQN